MAKEQTLRIDFIQGTRINNFSLSLRTSSLTKKP